MDPSETLSQMVQRVRARNLTYLSPHKLRRLGETAAKVLHDGVPGVVAEFGVALGGSSVLLASIALSADRAFAGFDVFAMIPPPASAKDDAKSRRRYEVIASGSSSGIGGDKYYGYRDNLYDEVRNTFESFGLPVDGKQIALKKGLFQETVPQWDAPSIAFAHLDCDWYDPVQFCLASLWPKLSIGGAIILDDYHAFGGCRRATDEFLQRAEDVRFEDGQNVILHKTG